jgi:hypothetical protein
MNGPPFTHQPMRGGLSRCFAWWVGVRKDKHFANEGGKY